MIREVFAPYSQQRNGISERCNSTVLDPPESMLTPAGMPNKLLAEAVLTVVYTINRLPSLAILNSTTLERWMRKTLDISHLRMFGCLVFALIHGDLRKKLDTNIYKCVLLGYMAESLTQYHVPDISLGRVCIARDVKFEESTPYYWQLKTKPTKIAFKPATQEKDSDIEEEPPKLPNITVQLPKALIQSPKTILQHPK
jgi:hypothetical protein